MSKGLRMVLTITGAGCEVELDGEHQVEDLEWVYDDLPALIGRAMVEAGAVEPGELLAETQPVLPEISDDQFLIVADRYLSQLDQGTAISKRRVRSTMALLSHAVMVWRLNSRWFADPRPVAVSEAA